MPKIIVLMGAPGAGKGTQARLLQERKSLPQISTGDIFRALAKADTPLAAEVRAVQAAGQLISDELVIRVVDERTSADDCRDGYILDGFPRTTVQAAMLEEIARRQGHELLAIFVDAPFELLEKRTAGRRTCPVCGEIYNVYFRPPKQEGFCDFHPEVALQHRVDDMPEKIKVRLATYEEQTKPLLDYYAGGGRLYRVDATRDPELVYADIERILTKEGDE
ncbi:MAG TPA: nucleoside monophosphate kinase [Pyrinomonadaceae bacterium]|jgi:adenylate kinase|nr:nucleoside monophosphate kinase [Pyrinomonadaceae bacterium]